MATQLSGDQLRVATNVLAIARKYRQYDHIPDLVHLVVTLQESGWNDSAAGDAGESWGPYQIYLPAHGTLTKWVACDPWYDYAYPEMHQRWADAWLEFSLQWANTSQPNRGEILERFAPKAQGSIAWPAGLGLERYLTALQALEQLS